MFDNVGGKIKGYAKLVMILEIILEIIIAIVLIAVMGFVVLPIVILGGAIVVVLTYISAMFIYGFGELIENTLVIKQNLKETYNINYETYSKIYDALESNGKLKNDIKL